MHMANRCIVTMIMVAATGAAAHAQVAATVEAALAPIPVMADGVTPNPAFEAWNANALQSLLQGGGAVGNPAAGPSAYVPLGTVNQSDFITTFTDPAATFPSWKGIADPAAPFDSQYGDGLAFSVRFVSSTPTLRLSNLDVVMSSDDPGDVYDAFSHTLDSLAYTPRHEGINWGPDGIPNTADDIVYNNGQDWTLPVNEILITGTVIAPEALAHAGADNQENINDSLNDFYSQYPMTEASAEYIMFDDSGNLLMDVKQTVNINVPEASSLGALLVGTLAMIARPRRKWACTR